MISHNIRKSDQQLLSLDRIEIKNPSQALISNTSLQSEGNTEKIIHEYIRRIEQPIITSINNEGSTEKIIQ